ncbi:MAG: DUF2634 domain-containing protein [Oscillospiraceae bacterium]
MIPFAGKEINMGTFEVQKPSLTYKMTGNRIEGVTEGRAALEQAIRLILQTERYAYALYSWNYGIELENLFGLNPDLLAALLETRIKEALKQDDRILDVRDFTFTGRGGVVHCAFVAETIFGEVEGEKDV